MRRIVTIILASLFSLVLFAGCSDSQTAGDKERKAKAQNYEALQNNQPTGTMSYSPTRETINFWIDTWDENGKISYVYLIANNGQKIGYYVFEGLPVSYCASQTQPEQINDRYEGDVVTTAPSMDGAYYGNCPQGTYYGKDAGTGSFIEFSTGGSMDYLLTEQPLPAPDVEPLTTTSVEDVENGG